MPGPVCSSLLSQKEIGAAITALLYSAVLRHSSVFFRVFCVFLPDYVIIFRTSFLSIGTRAVPPCAEIAAVAVAIFALAWLNKKKNQKNQMKNQKMNNLAFL